MRCPQGVPAREKRLLCTTRARTHLEALGHPTPANGGHPPQTHEVLVPQLFRLRQLREEPKVRKVEILHALRDSLSILCTQL